MQKLNFLGTHWRGLALIGTPKKTPDLRIAQPLCSLWLCVKSNCSYYWPENDVLILSFEWTVLK